MERRATVCFLILLLGCAAWPACSWVAHMPHRHAAAVPGTDASALPQSVQASIAGGAVDEVAAAETPAGNTDVAGSLLRAPAVTYVSSYR